ncbi:MAG: bifunctional adenosylcobinamide kinase/adenosylcobinamide-phosphate guanylyltransferase [Chloroflexota bacterium]
MAANPGSVTLILGGARGGKSAWAEKLAIRSGRPVVFLATATAGDAEMAARIAAHRANRPADWRTVEEPLLLTRAVQQHAHPGDLLLVDCLTLWVSNVVLARIGTRDPEGLPANEWRPLEDELCAAVEALIEMARAANVSLILVSNEVGLGIVPAFPLGRLYRDLLGQVNRVAAGHADSVIFMIAGLPVDLRRLAADLP